jgi:hypothetical protein
MRALASFKVSLLGKNLKLAYILCFRDSHRPALHASPHLAKSKTFLFGKRSKALEWHVAYRAQLMVPKVWA